MKVVKAGNGRVMGTSYRVPVTGVLLQMTN
jgi:hypothetical protein